jgi:hypothetical protein
MKDYRLDVNKIEELQMINDLRELDVIFQRAKSAIVCGGNTLLNRTDPSGTMYVFETISSLDDLESYKINVYKYLNDDEQQR